MNNPLVACPVDKPGLFRYSPHKGKMLLLDRLDAYSLSPASLSASVVITADSPFFDKEKNLVPGWVSFEYMAQAIALLAGLRSAAHGENPNIGFILGVRDFKTEGAGFPEGRTVSVSVRQVLLHKAVAVFAGEALLGGVRVSGGTLTTIESSPELIERMKENDRG